MKILFTGGGTLGPVTPLLAVFEAWKKRLQEVEAVWIGTPQGPEQELIEEAGVRFYSISVARFPRYISVEWLLLPWHLMKAFWKSYQILKQERPFVVCSAGGYTAVPVIIAAKFQRIPVWVHQQDVEAILTNLITAPFANLVTVAWKENLKKFPGAFLVGNPVRAKMFLGSREQAYARFKISEHKPTVFVFGGGSGAGWMNQVFSEIGVQLEKYANVIHVTGKGKLRADLTNIGGNYNVLEFLKDEMADAYAVSDLVVCRAGLATITELSALGMPAIVIPLPDSPQEKNVKVVQSAVTVVKQGIEAKEMLKIILDLIGNPEELKRQSRAIRECLKTDVADVLVDKLESIN